MPVTVLAFRGCRLTRRRTTSERCQSEIVDGAIDLIDHGQTLEGLIRLEADPSLRAIPVASSYLAYCIARERKQYREAIRLCQSALAAEPHNPTHYLNMGRIFLVSKQKGKAFLTFCEALAKGGLTGAGAAGNDGARQGTLILTELQRMGIRKRAPFPFLPRAHRLNRVVGKALTKLSLR